MDSEPSSARNATGVSEEDLHVIKLHAGRRRIALLLAGGVGAAVGLAAGHLSARWLYCEPRSDDSTYPFAASLLTAGIACRKFHFGIVGVVASIAAAFILMFVLTAVTCTPETQPTYYGVWEGEQDTRRLSYGGPKY